MPPSPASPDFTLPDQVGDGSRRVTWPDVAVLIVVIGFAVFLMLRGLTVWDATITAIATAGGVLSMLLLPRRITEGLKLLRAISRSITPPGPGGSV